MLLGTIGVGDFDLGDVIRLIKKGWINRKGIEEKEEKKAAKSPKKLGKLEKKNTHIIMIDFRMIGKKTYLGRIM